MDTYDMSVYLAAWLGHAERLRYLDVLPLASRPRGGPAARLLARRASGRLPPPPSKRHDGRHDRSRR
eukprot:13835420-Heterocapsa_arctica.AAC.1